jgi:phosphatidylserine/phosphatidylglycerophosphate/cardiolipin synthase-like enzyme
MRASAAQTVSANRRNTAAVTSFGRPTPPGGLVAAGLGDVAHACGQARSHIDIATPFLSADVAAYVVRACDDGTARERRFITALNVPAVEGGYLDPDGIEEFIAGGFEARSLRNLHAKAIIVDGAWALIGSGNLTVAGSNGANAELGIVLDSRQAKQARRDHFEHWWAAAEPVDLKWLRTLKRREPSSSRRRRREGQGGLLHTPASVDLRAFSRDRHDSGYWLKILYSDDDRMTARHWRRRMWVSDRHTDRPGGGDPLRRPSYKVGEHLVIYVTRGERQACPAVVRVAQAPEFDPGLVAREASREDAKKWGWVTWVEPVASIALSRAPSLSDIGVDAQSVRQQGHIHLDRRQYRRALELIRGW